MDNFNGINFRDYLANNELKVTSLCGVSAHLMFNNEFLEQCISQLEKLPMMMDLGHEITPLEKLGISIIFSHYKYHTGRTL